jgi:hypothetical protein
MKRICVLGFLMGMFATPFAFAATITLTLEGGSGYGPYQTGVGGEFTFRISNGSLISAYNSQAVNQASPTPSFQTFCVEGNEFISAGSTYTANYNNESVFTNFRLTAGAAYLYSQFATAGNFGGLASYNYGANRGVTAGLLQNAIWALMGGQEGQTAANNSSNPFLRAAEAQFGGTFAGANTTAATGFDNVYVLNLWDLSGRAAQDQLIYTPGPVPNVIPDGGMTAILLGLGLTGLGFVSRRLRY